MQDTNIQEINKDIISQGHGSWYASIIFLMCVIIASIALFLFDAKLQNDITKVNIELQDIVSKTDAISADKNIVIAKIIQENNIKTTIDLQNIVTQFRLAAIKANVAFDGFAIKDNTIRTTLVSIVGNAAHPDPVATIISMMNDYTNNEWKKFRLWKIKNISGDPKKRTTTIEFTVIPNTNK